MRRSSWPPVRLLLDECVPRRLGRELVGHEVATVQQQGWSGISNGQLLALAAPEFDVFLTVDQGIPYQQNFASLEIAIVSMVARSNDISDLRPLIPQVLEALSSAVPGRFSRIGS